MLYLQGSRESGQPGKPGKSGKPGIVRDFILCQGKPGKPGTIKDFILCQGKPGKPGIVREFFSGNNLIFHKCVSYLYFPKLWQFFMEGISNYISLGISGT